MKKYVKKINLQGNIFNQIMFIYLTSGLDDVIKFFQRKYFSRDFYLQIPLNNMNKTNINKKDI